MYDFIYKIDFIYKNVYVGRKKSEREFGYLLIPTFTIWRPGSFPVSENTENKPDLPLMGGVHDLIGKKMYRAW